MTSPPAAPDPSGTRAGTGTSANAPASAAASEISEIADLTTRLIRLGHAAVLSPADQAELAATVRAQVEAGRTLRRYPLANGDEPMLINDTDPGGSR